MRHHHFLRDEQGCKIMVGEGSEQPFFTLRNGIRICSVFSNTFIVELCSLAFCLHPVMWLFLFMVGMPFPQQIQSAITISLCYSYFPLNPLARKTTYSPHKNWNCHWYCAAVCWLPDSDTASCPQRKAVPWDIKTLCQGTVPFFPQDCVLVACLLNSGWFFLIEELNTKKKLPAWIKTGHN